MEPEKVFLDFLNLCTDHAGHLQYQLANNAILEWFGRTIRGKEKIKNFVRYELSQEYEHQFNNWKIVDPFEVRPSHFETKKLSLETPPEQTVVRKDYINDTTPQKSKIKLVELPALHRGRKFLTDIGSDDEDLRDLGLAKIDDTTPPSSPGNATSIGVDEGPALKKSKIGKFKNLFSSKDKNFKIREDFSSAIELNKCDADLKQTELCDMPNPQNTMYSDLHYIESVGCLITSNRSKYPGVQPLPIGGTNLEIGNVKKSEIKTYSYNISPRSHLEREVKLKISYRIRMDNNQIEFALIIYEYSVRKSSTRRNLLLEFKEASSGIEEKKTDSTSIIKHEKKTVDVKIRRKTPLKRLMRLF
ncbi:uncharacterized protein LOC129605460 [Condylostylus longicornis]|uniref:uncharacterized protein LOC129605460 n=1 Tax=Condylostylus longicornis TaxID=2530218 RepID=UPI00244DC658|nr:uncharacterized protein LOC129605460 [Condylostylus longicornis]